MTIEKIHELMDEVENAVREMFPGATRIMLSMGNDRYQNLSVYRMPDCENLPIEAWPRKELWDQWRDSDGEWSKDRSAEQNAYYKEIKILLEDA